MPAPGFLPQGLTPEMEERIQGALDRLRVLGVPLTQRHTPTPNYAGLIPEELGLRAPTPTGGPKPKKEYPRIPTLHDTGAILAVKPDLERVQGALKRFETLGAVEDRDKPQPNYAMPLPEESQLTPSPGVQDVMGRIGHSLVSGEALFENVTDIFGAPQDLSFLPEPLRTVADITGAPLTWLTAGYGGPLAAAARAAKIPAAGVLEPLLNVGGTGLKGVALRSGAEGVILTGALEVGEQAQEALPEGTPDAVRIAVEVATTLVAAGGAVGILRGSQKIVTQAKIHREGMARLKAADEAAEDLSDVQLADEAIRLDSSHADETNLRVQERATPVGNLVDSEELARRPVLDLWRELGDTTLPAGRRRAVMDELEVRFKPTPAQTARIIDPDEIISIKKGSFEAGRARKVLKEHGFDADSYHLLGAKPGRLFFRHRDTQETFEFAADIGLSPGDGGTTLIRRDDMNAIRTTTEAMGENLSPDAVIQELRALESTLRDEALTTRIREITATAEGSSTGRETAEGELRRVLLEEFSGPSHVKDLDSISPVIRDEVIRRAGTGEEPIKGDFGKTSDKPTVDPELEPEVGGFNIEEPSESTTMGNLRDFADMVNAKALNVDYHYGKQPVMKGMLSDTAEAMAEQSKGLFSRVIPKYFPEALHRVALGVDRIGSGLVGHRREFTAAARIVSGYLNAQGAHNIVFGTALHRQVQKAFGANLELIRFKPGVSNVNLQEFKAGFDLAMSAVERQGQVVHRGREKLVMHGTALTMVHENPALFALTPLQKVALGNVVRRFNYDVAASRHFGVEVKPIVNYMSHRVEFMRNNKIVPTTHIARIFTLGSKKSFQYPRLFENMTDFMVAATKTDEEWEAVMQKLAAKARREAQEATNPLTVARHGEEADRIDAMVQAGIRPRPKAGRYEEAVMERLAQSATLRGEKLAERLAQSFGLTLEETSRLTDLLQPANPGTLVKVLEGAAVVPRTFVLTLDAGIYGIQFWGAFVTNPRDVKNMLVDKTATALSSDRHAQYMLANLDEISDATVHGLQLSGTVLEMEGFVDDMLTGTKWGTTTVKDPSTGKSLLLGGAPIEAGGIRPFRSLHWINEVSFGRLVGSWKLETYKHITSMLDAATTPQGSRVFLPGLKKGHVLAGLDMNAATKQGRTAYHLRRRHTATFVNNLFGGLDRVGANQTTMQQIVERLVVLTPGFTRATLNLGFKAMDPKSLEGALARDFFVRGTLIAGLIMTGFSALMNLPSGNVAMPNFWDPSRSDWFTVATPWGGRWAPLSRFRGAARVPFKAIQGVLEGNAGEAGAYFMQDSASWLSYRQSAAVSLLVGDVVGDISRSAGVEGVGNPYTQGQSVKDILFNPWANRLDQARETLGSSFSPIGVQRLAEQVEMRGLPKKPIDYLQGSLDVGMELLGVNTYTPTANQDAMMDASLKWAEGAGIDEDVIQRSKDERRPVYTLKKDGVFMLTRAQRQRAREMVAEETGLDDDVVSQFDRSNEKSVRQITQALEESQLSGFLERSKVIREHYSSELQILTAQVHNGSLSHADFSRALTQLRRERANFMEENTASHPKALEYFSNASYAGKQNPTDAILDQIAAELAPDQFLTVSSITGLEELDFAALAKANDAARIKYGARYEEYVERRNERKSPLERQRDEALEDLEPHFKLAELGWADIVQMGANPAEFEAAIGRELAEQNVTDPLERQQLITLIMQNEPFKEYQQVVRDARRILREENPALDTLVQLWFGLQPLRPKTSVGNRLGQIRTEIGGGINVDITSRIR